MPKWIIAFFLGTVSLFCFSRLPPLYWIGIPLLPLITLSLTLPTHTQWRRYSYLCLVFIAGFCWAMLHAHSVLQEALPQALEGKTIVVQGYVASIPERQAHGISFEFSIQNLAAPRRVRLNWQGEHDPVRVGDAWQLQVRLKQPHGNVNPGSFDYEKWLFEHRINALGYVHASPKNFLLEIHRWRQPIDRLRQHLAESIKQILSNSRYIGFMTALTVGVRDEITPDQWQVMRNTGTNHLMAIAGLHIGLMTGMVFFMINFLWRRTGKFMLYLPVPQAAACGALIIAILYSALAGFALPTQRAVIMLTVFLITTLLRRQLPPWNALLIAMFLILILDPLAPLSDSFWLSFGAVAMIIVGMSARLHTNTLWWRWGRTQWVVAVGLIPLSLLCFQQVSLIGFIANIIAIPWVGFIVLPLGLIGVFLFLISPTSGSIIFLLAERLLAVGWPVMQWLAGIQRLQWYSYIHNQSLLLAVTIMSFLLLAPRGFPGRWLAGIWVLPLVIWTPPGPNPGEIWFTLLDVGQGLSAVIQTQHHVAIFDTGARFSDNFDMGDSVVIPYLRTIGARQVDRLIISHGDNDHIGGAYSVLAQIPVKHIVTSEPTRFLPRIAGYCQQGQTWQWDGVTFEFLYPQRGNQEQDNDRSCVLRISNQHHSLLLTGDIERKSEQYLLANYATHLPATILVVPHHGSRTSSTLDFIRAVHPQYALLAVGYRNRYRLPNKEVLARYDRGNIARIDTVTSGAIHFKIPTTMAVLPPTQYRIKHRHYWNAESTTL